MMKRNTISSANASPQRLPNSAVGGFTLIEVLVALAILVVGIFALIELFPPGFFTIQVSANETAANNLARAELERLASNNVNSLEGVYALAQDPNTGAFAYNPLDLPDPHLRDTLLNTSSDIDAERAIQGELVRIAPAVSVYPYVNGVKQPNPVQLSIYVPNFAPIQMSPNFVGYVIDRQTGQLSPTTNQTQLTSDNFVLKVGGLPWTRIVGDSSTTVPGSQVQNNNYSDPNAQPTGGQPQYLVDYNAMKLAVGPEFQTPPPGSGSSIWYVQPFNFTVTGTDGDTYSAQFVWDPSSTPAPGNIQGYLATGSTPGSQWFSIPAALWTDTTKGTSGNLPPGWLPGTDKLWRDFHLVYNANTTGVDLATYVTNNGGTFGAAFTQDPYSYAIAEPDLDTGKSTDMGVLAFNPTAAQIKDSNGNPLMASISYSAADWHIIHEDHTLGSNGGQNPVARLSLKDIYQIGQSLPDNSLYGGIIPQMTSPVDVVVLDLQTGQSTVDINPRNDLIPNVDYNNGVATFQTNAAGDHVRIFYKANGDWGLALVKAPAVYQLVPLNVGATPASPYPGPTPTSNPVCYVAKGTTLLYFPPTDEGKMVRIGNVRGSDGKLYSDANVRIIEPGPIIGGVPQYSTVDLAYNANDPSNDPDGDKGVLPAGVTISTTLTPVQSVTGSSVTARVVWKDRTVWRHRDLMTLTANAQP